MFTHLNTTIQETSPPGSQNRGETSEDMFRASETSFRRLFETAESGFLMLDARSMTILAANPFLCQLVGHSAGSLVGMNLWETRIFAHQEAIQAAFSILWETASLRYEDLPMRALSGSIVHVGFSANKYDEGGVEVIQCTVRDITENRRLLEVAQAASARLIDDLLDLTRVSLGKLHLHVERVCVGRILRDAVENIRDQIDAKGLTLAMTGADEQVFVKADALRLQQVFWNILSNAVKFTQPGGAIAIQAARDKSRETLVLQFSDNGVGINPPELGRIFEPFRQVDDDGGYGGLGLGLAIAQKIIDLHVGTIKAASPGTGHGSVFRIELAYLPEAVTQPVGSAELWPKATPYGLEGTAVLYVEDDASSRRTLTRVLSARKLKVTSVGTFAEAKAVGLTEKFDLLITDIGLPDGTGLDLLAICGCKSPGIKGIAMSGYGAPADLARSAAAGFAVHIVKPITIKALESALPRAMASQAPFVSHSRERMEPFDHFQGLELLCPIPARS